MKKIVIIDSFRSFGGGQHYLERLIELLQDRYIFYTITFSEEVYHRLLKKEFNVHYIPTKRYYAFLEIRKIVKSLNPDLIILNGQFEAHFSFLFPFRKIIFIRHTSLSMTTSIKKFLYFIEAILFADSIVVVNDFMIEQLPFFIRKKTKVIYNWTSLSCKTNKNFAKLKKDRFSILYCGRLTKEKNVNLIIEACKDLVDLVDLHILGTGEEYSELFAKYSNYKNVYFHGYVQNEETRYYYEIADIYIQVSNMEAFPLAVLDALCYGLPVILSRIPAHIDISKNGECALLVDPKIEDIKNAILMLINDKSLRETLSMKALLRVQDFSHEKSKKKYLELFEDLIKPDIG